MEKNKKGELVDRQGRKVNPKGYLLGPNGSIINQAGEQVFNKDMIDPEGDVPKVFRTGLLRSDSESSLSKLMSEIEKNNVSEFDQDEKEI